MAIQIRNEPAQSVGVANSAPCIKNELDFTPASHATDTDNPHRVTIDQIGAAPKSHATDTSNPHKVTAAQVGAAPASHATSKNNPHSVTAAQLGAMEKAAMGGYSDQNATDETGLNTWLDQEVLPSMKKDTCKHIVFRCGAICSWLLMGTIYKNTDDYAVIDVVEHLTGRHYTKVKQGSWKNTVPTDLIYTSGNIFSDTFTTKEKDASRFYVVEIQNAINFNRDTIVVNVYTTGEGTLRYTRPFYFDSGGDGTGHEYHKLAVTKFASGAVKFEMESSYSTLFRITGYA